MNKLFALRNVWTEDDVRFLSKYGITRKEKDCKSVIINDGPIYQELHAHFFKKSEHPLYEEAFGFEYTESEVLSSEYCLLFFLSGRGYPQPEDGYSYRKQVYDMSKYCDYCGQEKVQIGDYGIISPPRRSMWTYMAWVFDAVFVTETLYEDVFKPLGIGWRHVNKKSGKVFEGVLQLDIPVLDENLDLSMFEYEICPVCGRKKYGAKFHVPFFPQPLHPLPHMFFTKEYFGYGGSANRKLIITTELAKKLIDMKLIRLKDLIPCRSNYSEYLKTINY